MSEFKGTKVFPKYEGGDNYSIDMIFESGATISIDRRDRYSDKLVMYREEMEANAKLISCAPLMLEKLKETLEVLKWYMNNTHPEDNQHESFFNIGMNDIVQIEELISKATEL